MFAKACALLSSLLIVADTSWAEVPTGARHSIAIFYDAGAASAAFFERSLCAPRADPGWRAALDRVDIELVPFGRTRHRFNRTQHRNEFACDADGDAECALIKKHACVVWRGAPTEADWRTLEDVCGLFDAGRAQLVAAATPECDDNFLANSGTRTESIRPPIEYFPAVMVDDNYVEEESHQYVDSFGAKLNALLGGSSGAASAPQRALSLAVISLLCLAVAINARGA